MGFSWISAQPGHKTLYPKPPVIAGMITLFKTNHMMYKKSLEQQRSEFASLETARENGKAEGKAEGIVQGRAEGIVQGKAEGRAEIIRQALASHTPVSMISKVLGIDLETIQEIEASLESSHP